MNVPSIFRISPLQKELTITIVLTLTIGFGATSFFSIRENLDDLEKVEKAKIDLLYSAIQSDVREDMLNYNAQLVIDRLQAIQESTDEIARVRMFRNSGEEAFLDNKTVKQVNAYRDSNIFPQKIIPENLVPDRIAPENLKEIVLTESAVGFEEYLNGIPLYTKLIPVIIDERCKLCHGYENNNIRGILQISVPRTQLFHAKTHNTILEIVTSLLAIIFVSAIMSLIIHKRIVKPVSDVTFNISSAAAQQDRITIQQASSVNEITSTIEELNTSTKEVSENAEALANQSKKTLAAAYEGQKAIDESISEMNMIKNKVQAIAEEVLALSENTNQIGAIINVVEDIANRTDMLALNASIEAAKAGEQGKGFAVVAAEVRSLSDQSKKSTEKVATLIQEIQASVSSTVLATEEGAKKVDAGVAHILSAGDTINNAINTMKANVDSNKEIAIASHEGSMASQLVLEAMIHINDSMKEATTATRESFRTVQKLLHLVDKRRVLRPDLADSDSLQSQETDEHSILGDIDRLPPSSS